MKLTQIERDRSASRGYSLLSADVGQEPPARTRGGEKSSATDCYPRDLRMPRYSTRQPFVERGTVDPPAAADFEAGQLAALYQAIDGGGMDAQYIGDLGDSENTSEFPMLYRTPFQRFTDLRSRDLDLPRNLHRRDSQFPNRETCRPLCQFVSNFHAGRCASRYFEGEIMVQTDLQIEAKTGCSASPGGLLGAGIGPRDHSGTHLILTKSGQA